MFINEHYKACALLLFSLIDSVLIHAQDETQYEGNRKQGNSGIKKYEIIAKPTECQKLTTKVLYFIATTEALYAFFQNAPNFQNNNPVLNRHLSCHGMLQRPVNKIDCIQLILLYENMLHCVRI